MGDKKVTSLTEAEADELLRTDPDAVCMARYGCSLKRVMERFPDGVPDAVAAKALNISEREYQEVVNNAVAKLRAKF